MRSFSARLLPVLALLLPVAALAAAPPPSGDSVRVETFSPEGYVKRVRQVEVRFTTSMVALGDPRLADPFAVDCPAPGKGRWADTRNWVYDFDADLDAGVSCRFSLKPGLKSKSGGAVTGPSVFTFNTGGPAITASLPREGTVSLDEDQIFLLRLDAPATSVSIETNAYCAVDGVVERIPIQVLAGQERQAVLDQRKLLGYDYLQLLFKSGEFFNIRARNRAMERRDELITVLRCQRRLPPATKVLLHWGAGIATASGIVTETDQQLAFRVRPAFTAQVECTRTNPRAGCMPMLPIAVNFSAPVPRAQALAIRLKAADGTLFTPTVREAAQVRVVEGVSFAGPFPESSTVTAVLPRKLVDDAGRALDNAARFPLAVRVDSYPPLVKFSGTFGILEAREGGILPVTLRNVEPMLAVRQSSMAAKFLRVDADAKTITAWLGRVEDAARPSGEWVQADTRGEMGRAALKPKLEDQEESEGEENAGRPRRVWRDTTGAHSVFADSDATTAFAVKKPAGQKPEEVIGIPLKQPGFYVLELASQRLGATLLGYEQTRYVATTALVTDLAVHFKWGRESSLVWVTRLSDGKPVAEADVAVSDGCDGSTLWQGRTGIDGIAVVTQSLGEPRAFHGCPREPPLLVLAKQGDDFSFTESSWDQGIRPYEFGLPVGSSFTVGIYHTVLDRSLFQAGETVSMKHFQRQHVSEGLTVAAGSSGEHRVTVVHEGSDQRYQLSATFDSNGVATSDWKIPAEAKLGEYVVSIDGHPSAHFKVEQFRLPSMRASVVGLARPLVAPKQIDLNLHVAYMSGGGAGGLPVKVRTLVEPRPLHFDGYADYQFGGTPVREGVTTMGNGPADFDFESDAEAETTRTQTLPLVLDASGSGRVTLTHLPATAGPARLTAELEYADANGETLTTTGYVRLVPASLSLGIRPESWVGSPGQLRFRVVALDLDGKPQSRQPIVVSLYQSNTYSYRKRLIGGFYSYESTRETTKLKPTCSGTTNAQGLLMCEVAPGASGQILVRAETRDAHDATVGATSSMWVFDQNAWWFGGTGGDRMDLLPEKKEYEAGETARLQVRMPFREATALVTVEREGVLNSFVTQLHGNAPIIEVPVAPGYAPNVFISVLAVRGRAVHAEPGLSKSPPGGDEVTALVDLTKPAYRLGAAQIKVGWRPHRLNVQVQPEQQVYKIREQAAVAIHVARADGQMLLPGTEVAVAAVDEALLDLAPNESWALLESMMGERGLEVWTSTGQMQVVGKRHYGRKAIPHGGGGGRELDRARELFGSLLYWQPRVALDAQGNASVSIPLNDSLSSFRIVAVAHSGAQLFGTGDARFNTTQDLILLSGLPPLVREADRYAATFTVRNTTGHAIAAQVQVSSTALGARPAMQEVQLAPGQSRDVVWPVTAPVDAGHIDWDVTAQDMNRAARDHLKVSEKVIPTYPVRTYQATIAQLTAPLTIPVQRPSGAIEGRGGLEVTLQAQLSGSLDGVREYMSFYPYVCLEQLASRAVVLHARSEWDALMQRLPAYMDEDGLLKYFPTERLQGDDGLTSYILAIGHEAGWPLFPIDQVRLTNALTRFVEGKIIRDSALPTADLAIRKLQAIDALSRYGAASPQMLDSITVEPNLLPTSALLDWIGILERVPNVPQADVKLREAFGLLRARLNFQGTTMGFSTERDDALWWLMISADSNANRMLLAVVDRPEWSDDVPRLVRGSLGRQQFGHWNTTVANAWGTVAMDKFSAAFEATPVGGSTALRYGDQRQSLTWPQADTAPVISVPWQPDHGSLQLTHAGSGAPWAMVRAMAALPLDQPLSSGFKITRTVTPVERRQPDVWTRGDVARVHLELEAQSDMSWVVVDDPIPAGSSILGSGLGGQSELLQRDDRPTGWVWLAFEERRFDGYRAYYRFVPKGHWTVEYTVRLNNPGTFELPATRVEAMYAPEMFGEMPNANVTVQSDGAVR
jgi:alpha-2-macroglobulin